MQNITDANFEEQIKQNEKLVLVDFFAEWCGPCQVLGPIMENVVEEFKNEVELIKVNVDDFPMTSQKFGIDRIPNVILFKDGKQIDGFIGLLSAGAIKEWIKKAIEKNSVAKSSQDNQKEAGDLISWYENYAKENGFKLNPDKNVVERVVKGLFANEAKHGEKYCPCRRVTGDKEADKKIICPCIYHKDEIEKDGKCFCGLFVK